MGIPILNIWDPSTQKYKSVPAIQGPAGAGVDVTGASVGQIAKISAVDDNGVPTAWEPVDIPASGGEEWELIDEVALSKDTLIYNLVDFAVYRKAWIIMTRPSNVSATVSIIRVTFARKSAPLEKWFSADILGTEFTKLHFDIQAEVTNLFATADRRRYDGDDYGMPVYSRGLKLLGDVSPDELILFMKFTNGDMIQEGDKLTILGVKR